MQTGARVGMLLSLETKERPWKTLQIVGGGVGLCTVLVYTVKVWPDLVNFTSLGSYSLPVVQPLSELLKLVVAAVLGMGVTAVHKRYHCDKPLSRSLEQAQVLLCVSGAMMMIIIGDSLARAFGIAGAASIIRFRTPVEDPKDTIILFLLLGLGMSCGLSAFGVAVLAALFLCLVILVLDHTGEQKPRAMMLAVVANGSEFPTAHVQNVFATCGMISEPREVSHGNEAMVKYHVILAPNTSLEYLSEQLMNGGAMGIKSVAWELPKKGG